MVRAAGGLVLRGGTAGEPEVALVHRPKYDDWSFPKGKLKEGETHETAALREVQEETGLRCSLDREVESLRYRDSAGRPKVVRYWTMRPIEGHFRATKEIDQMRWTVLGEAIDLLTHDHDRDLLRSVRADLRSGEAFPQT